jgi:peptidoglycan L-alanyl-D-glutamate endopeptidase CwlK
MINSRKIEDLLPEVQPKVQAFLAAATAKGIDLLITSSYRDFESQAAIFAQGRTTPGAKVTNAQAGHSWHNWRCAVDVVPLIGGKAIWSDEKLWEQIGEIGESVGLEWAGRWVSFKELAHFQFTSGHTLAGLLAAHPHGLDVTA